MPLPTRPIAETNSTWRCGHRADTENDPALRTLWQSIRSPLFLSARKTGQILPGASTSRQVPSARSGTFARSRLVTLDDVAGAQTTERLPRVVARSAHAGGVCSLV